MNREPCSVGKDFNPKTCRFIQSCKPGYSRNKDFKCVKDSTAPKRSVGKEKLGLLKGLFSNENGLVNSPLSRRSISKRLKRTKYPELIFNENGNEIPPLEPIQSKKFTQEKIKSMKNFLKTLTPGEKINWGQIKTLARSKGVKLDTDADKRTFKDLVVDFASGVKSPTKPKRGLKTKKVHFKNGSNFSKALDSLKNNWAELNQSKANASKNTSKPKKSLKTKPPIAQSKANASTKSTAKTVPKKSLSKMTIKDALEIMKITEIYTMDDLAEKYKEISTSLHPDKSFDEKKTTPEFKVLNKAFEILKKRIDKSGKSKPLRKSGTKKSKIVKSNVQSNDLDHSLKNVTIPTDDTIINLHSSNLYNPETVFKFYSLSADRSPGKGPGEKIKSGDESKYLRLSEHPDWRKMLSNFWIEPFVLEGKRWQSVEHYYQGSKFKGTPDFYNQFSLDSGSELSKDPILAKIAGGKSGKRKGISIRGKEIKIDDDFFPNRSKIEMYKAQHAKFTQSPRLSSVLKLTGDAKLVHHVRGSQPVVFDNLMYIRSKL